MTHPLITELIESFDAYCAVENEQKDEGLSFERLYDAVDALRAGAPVPTEISAAMRLPNATIAEVVARLANLEYVVEARRVALAESNAENQRLRFPKQDKTYERHHFEGDAADCQLCGEGVCHYLHIDDDAGSGPKPDQPG